MAHAEYATYYSVAPGLRLSIIPVQPVTTRNAKCPLSPTHTHNNPPRPLHMRIDVVELHHRYYDTAAVIVLLAL